MIKEKAFNSYIVKDKYIKWFSLHYEESQVHCINEDTLNFFYQENDMAEVGFPDWLCSNLQCILDSGGWATLPSSLISILCLSSETSQSSFQTSLERVRAPCLIHHGIRLINMNSPWQHTSDQEVSPELFHMFTTHPSLNKPATPGTPNVCSRMVFGNSTLFCFELNLLVIWRSLWLIRSFHSLTCFI